MPFSIQNLKSPTRGDASTLLLQILLRGDPVPVDQNPTKSEKKRREKKIERESDKSGRTGRDTTIANIVPNKRDYSC